MDLIRTDWFTRALWSGTVLAFGIVVWLLWGAGLFRWRGHFPALDDLEHIGSFIGGVFTPIAVGWAARTFLLQRQQMVDTLIAMNTQLDLQRTALDHVNEQLTRDRLAQLEGSDPQLLLSANGGMSNGQGTVYNFKLKNEGANAQRIKIDFEITNNLSGEKFKGPSQMVPGPIGKGDAKPYSIFILPSNKITHGKYTVNLTMLAERMDRLVTRFTFEATDSMQFVLANTERARTDLTLD